MINECHSFVLKVSVSDHVDVCSNVKTNCLLVDCGATAYIINDRSNLVTLTMSSIQIIILSN